MSRSQFHRTKVVHRHAWLNLWDKRTLLAGSTRYLTLVMLRCLGTTSSQEFNIVCTTCIVYLSLHPWHTISQRETTQCAIIRDRELQPTPPSLVASASQHNHITVHHLHAVGCLVQTAAMSDCSLVVVQPKSRMHWHPTQSVATVPLLNMLSESSDCRIPCSAAGLAIGARSALQRPSQTLWIHQTRTGVHRAVRKCDHRSVQLEFTGFHRTCRQSGTLLVE